MSSQLFVFGTGAHARKVAHYAHALGWVVAAFVDEAQQARSPLGGIPVLPADALPAPGKGHALFVAIGNPSARRRLMGQLEAQGWQLPTLVHPSAVVAQDAVLEAGVLVAAGAVVETASVIGRGAIIDIGVMVDHDCLIGAFAHLRAGTVCGPRSHVASPE